MFPNKVVHLFISIVIFILHLCGRYSLLRVALLFNLLEWFSVKKNTRPFFSRTECFFALKYLLIRDIKFAYHRKYLSPVR